MLALCAALVLSSAPVSIEVIGLTVENRPQALTVTAVKAGSPAAKAGFEPGMVLTGPIFTPRWLFAEGKLSSLSDVDLHDALTPPQREALMLGVQKGTKALTLSVRREDPLPPGDPFPPLLENAKVLRLSELQRYHYFVNSPEGRATRHQLPQFVHEPLTLAFEGVAPTLEVGPTGLSSGKGASWSPQWVYFEGKVAIECPASSPMRSVEITSTAPGPKQVFGPQPNVVNTTLVMVELPLWRVSDAREACRQQRNSIPSVPVTGVLKCEGQPPRTVALGLPLLLECGETAVTERFRHPGLRVENSPTIFVGEKATRELSLRWFFHPRPVSVDILELDGSGTLRKRWATLKPPASGDESSLPIVIDTNKPRSMSFVAELKFPDGSVERGVPQTLSVVTHEEDAAAGQAEKARFDNMSMVMASLKKTFPDPCADLPATIAWLNKQPGVTNAGTADNGLTLSFLIGGRGTMVLCRKPGHH